MPSRRPRPSKNHQRPAAGQDFGSPSYEIGKKDSRSPWYLAGILAVGAVGLYAVTAAHDITLGDSAELAAVAATLGVAHPPGYPLLTMLGHALVRLGPGSVAFRTSLVSVLAGGGCVGLVFLTAYRLTRDWVAAAAAALLLAVQPLVWEWSLVIEAFALNAFLTLAALYALIRWDERADRPGWLIAAAGLTGLGMANHHTSAVVAVPALVALWTHRGVVRRQPLMAVTAALALVPGFLLYAYLPWAASRQPALNWGDISSFRDLAGHFVRASYGTFTLSAGVAPSPTPELLGAFAGTFTGIEAILVAVGLVLAWWSGRRALLTLGLAALFAGPVFAVVSAFDLSTPGYTWVLARFFVLPHVLLAPFAAIALAAACTWLRSTVPVAITWLWPAALSVGVVGAVAVQLHKEYPGLDQSRNHLARQFATDVLQSLPPRAVLVSTSDVVTLPVAYLQAVEGARPDVTQLMSGPLSRGDWYIRELRQRAPDLRIPFDHYDPTKASTSLRAIVDANPDRTFALVGPPPDGSLEPDYWLLPVGLTLVVEPQKRDVALADMDAANDRLFAAFRPPSSDVHAHSNFDPYVLRAYATAARLVGLQHLGARQPDEAARWLRLALAIDPSDDESAALLKK